MKKIPFVFILLVVSNYSLLAQRSVPDSSGKAVHKAVSLVSKQAIDVESYTDRKLVYIVLPAEPDTALTGQIERFQQRFEGKVKVIGLVSLEGKNEDTLARRYARLSQAGVLLSEGIKQRKEGSPQRTSVMEWVCEKRRALQESEQKEVGSKYFISEDGRLYAVLGADMPLDHPLMSSIVYATMPTAVYQEDPSLSPQKEATGKTEVAKP